MTSDDFLHIIIFAGSFVSGFLAGVCWLARRARRPPVMVPSAYQLRAWKRDRR